MANQKGIAAFLLLAFGISWLLAGTAWLAGAGKSNVAMLLVSSAFMWGPGVAALVVRKWLAPDSWASLGLGASRHIRWGWVGVAWLFPVVLMGGVLGVVAALGNIGQLDGFGKVLVTREGMIDRVTDMMVTAGQNPALAQVQLDKPVWITLSIMIGSGLLAGATINLIFALGEELGWRGYLWQVTRSWGFWKSNAFIGVVWGLWHAPLILQGHNYPGYPVAGVFVMVGFTLSLSFLMAYFRAKSGSIFSAAAFHGVLNALAGGVALLVHGGHVLLGSVVGLAAMLAGFLLSAVVLVLDRGFIRNYRQPDSRAAD